MEQIKTSADRQAHPTERNHDFIRDLMLIGCTDTDDLTFAVESNTTMTASDGINRFYIPLCEGNKPTSAMLLVWIAMRQSGNVMNLRLL